MQNWPWSSRFIRIGSGDVPKYLAWAVPVFYFCFMDAQKIISPECLASINDLNELLNGLVESFEKLVNFEVVIAGDKLKVFDEATLKDVRLTYVPHLRAAIESLNNMQRELNNHY